MLVLKTAPAGRFVAEYVRVSPFASVAEVVKVRREFSLTDFEPIELRTGATSAKAGVTEFDAADALPVPTLFVAVTVNVYGVPLVRPVTVIGEAVPVPV